MLRTLVLAVLFAAPQALQFEVASIRPRLEQPERGITTGAQIGPGQVRLEYVSLKDCIAMAYRVAGDRIVGPDWLAATRFDVVATLPAGATRQQVPAMMQALLAERFTLKTHRETRELPAFELRLANAAVKFETAALDPEQADQPTNETMTGSGEGIVATLGRGAGYALQKGQFEARKVTMAMLAEAVGRFVGRPVVDATGLSGHFNIRFETPNVRILTVRYGASVGVPVPPDALQFANDVAGAAMNTALGSVGLSLESRVLPLDVLVVDAIERTPTDN
jgi:uncharacterized protein (TIGR03435 family)